MSEIQRDDLEAQLVREQGTDDNDNGEINMQALAAKVYELLIEEAKIERERQGRRRS